MNERPDDVAIIGVGALFPGAPDAATFWDNIVSGKDCITELPESRSDPRYFDPSSSAIDRIPTRRGGFVGESVRFDAGAFGIMPVAALGAEPDQMLALQVAAATLDDAGYARKDFARDRTAVILGRGGYLTPGMLRLHRKVRVAEQLVTVLRDVVPGITDDQLEAVKTRFQDGAGHVGPDTAIGLVPNLAASRISNRLDLQGPAYTVDAACASALIAVEHGVRELVSGRCELVLAGGVHLTHEVGFWSVFSQLGALSRSGCIRPFDRRADGLLIGEGIGMLALKRLADAERDHDRVYAVIAGVGSGSDGRAASVMVPRVDGQVLALERAWRSAGLDPQRLGLIEAHGTATAAGDRSEIETLRRVFGDPGAAIGSVKSMIGHTMPAAGAAGLIKAALAVHHGVLPPSLHCEEPSPLLGTGWRVPSRAEEWAGERIAGVNAFGFGGINAHVVLRGAGEAVPSARRSRRPSDQADAEVLLLAADAPEALADALDAGRTRGGSGPCRLAMLDPTPERVAQALDIVQKWKPRAGRKGIWFRPNGGLLEHGKLVFLFPGIEATFAPDVDGLAERFGLDVPDYMRPNDLEETGRGVIGLGRFLFRILTQLGLKPDLVAGHSIGEWNAMLATGVLADADVDAFLTSVPVGDLQVAGVQFAAAGCGREVAEAAIEGLENIAVSHDNCPHQILLCGHDASIAVARERLMRDGVLCQVLPFRSGFHSPLFEESVGAHMDLLRRIPLSAPQLPLYSATTASRFPDDPDAIRALAAEHLVAPLRWRELLLQAYADGGRVFVQVGTGSLPNFVRDTLGDLPHAALSVLSPRQDALVGLRNLMLALFVEGLDLPLDIFVPQPSLSVNLPLGTPIVHVEGVTVETAATADPSVPEELRAELDRTLSALRRGPLEVVAALGKNRTAADRVTLSVDTIPALVDHAFFPQASDWPHIADAHPVVPMTLTLEFLMDIAGRLAPGLVPVEIADVELLRWIAVHPPLKVERRARLDEDAPGWVRAEVVGYASARVRFAEDYGVGTASLPALVEPVDPPCTAAELYADRWMFHGPAYQGVIAVGPWDRTGVDGRIRVPTGPGALLDNAGQLLGYWLIASADLDRLAMPKGLGSARFFGPPPEVGAELDVRLRITHTDERTIVGDAELMLDGELYCRITQWADHRFKTGPRVWDVMRAPESNVVAERHGAFWLVDDQAIRAPSRDWLARRYLGAAERDAMSASRTPRQYLNARMAANDAVRSLCWESGAGPLFPVQVPHAGVFVATAAQGQLAVAIAGHAPVGIGLDADPERAESAAREGIGDGGMVGRATLGELSVVWVRQSS
ncbi:MAG: beta-ketoacyl synthase N-terminal-like domain-containing protein [Myxococcota bacterium]